MKDTKNKLFANMNMNVNTNTKSSSSSSNGFTIIEVALVLAIAGLIFLVVFLALPALQNSQKDTARKQDVGRVVSALQAYEADHNGILPNPASASGGRPFYASNGSYNNGIVPDFSGYLGKLGAEIKGVSLMAISEGGNVSWVSSNDPNIDVFPGVTCTVGATATSSEAAVVVVLSNGTKYCADM